ncbi:MAG: hypothetical protein QW394_08790 [Thermofilaceae archaeon]
MVNEARSSGEPLPIEFKPGFTWRSVLALVIAAAIFLPVNTYLLLVAGASIAGAAVYILVLLFTELSTIIGVSMTKQEITIVFALGGLAAGTASYLGMVLRHYFVTSNLSWSFIDPYSGESLPLVVPSWYAPSALSEAVRFRSFFHRDWIIPLIIVNIQFGLFYVLQEIALAMIYSLIFIEEEKLSFPLAYINAQLITTLSERDPAQLKIFTLSAVGGAVYAAIVYGLPTISLGMFNVPLQIIPIPWFDLTSGYYGIEQFLPGAMFGVATDPISWALGMLLPFKTVASILLGSLSIWVFGNWLATTYLRDQFPLWAQEWRKGMNLALVWQRSYLRIWAVPSIGFILALATITIASGWRSFIRTFRALTRVRGGTGASFGYPSLSKIIAMYVIGAYGSVVLFQLLVPDFPLWVSILVPPLTFAVAAAATHARGETGLSFSVPFLWNMLVLASGYPKCYAWFISPVIGGDSAPSWVETIKVATLTQTKPIDFFKAYALTVVLYNIFSFIYVSFFWAIAPIPSSQYPFTMVNWPIQLVSFGVWFSRQIVADLRTLLYSYSGMIGLGAIMMYASKYTRFPLDFVALVTGTQTIPPYSVAMFIGGLIGKILERWIGRSRFYGLRNIVIAGLGMGMGVVVGIGGAITLIAKSTWLKPF